jgi:Uma2 family endonuclease
MAAAGILGADERLELIEGQIVQITPIGSPHASSVKRTTSLFYRLLGDCATISVQDPVRLSNLSEPEPDVAVLRPRADFYAGAHPTPADVLLLVEVVDTTLRYDRRVKLPLYARSGIPEVWLVILAIPGTSAGQQSADGGGLSGDHDVMTDARRRRVMRHSMLGVHRQPSPDGYQETRRLRPGQAIAPLAFPDCEVPVAELVGETAAL